MSQSTSANTAMGYRFNNENMSVVSFGATSESSECDDVPARAINARPSAMSTRVTLGRLNVTSNSSMGTVHGNSSSNGATAQSRTIVIQASAAESEEDRVRDIPVRVLQRTEGEDTEIVRREWTETENDSGEDSRSDSEDGDSGEDGEDGSSNSNSDNDNDSDSDSSNSEQEDARETDAEDMVLIVEEQEEEVVSEMEVDSLDYSAAQRELDLAARQWDIQQPHLQSLHPFQPQPRTNPARDPVSGSSNRPRTLQQRRHTGGTSRSASSKTLSKALNLITEVAQKTRRYPPTHLSSSYLQPGVSFSGSQGIGQPSRMRNAFLFQPYDMNQSDWEVKVTLSSIDLKTGRVIGEMQAIDVPSVQRRGGRKKSVTTFWEGEVVDLFNNEFWTRKWGANRRDDVEHWKLFEPFEKFLSAMEQPLTSDNAMKLLQDLNDRYVFMRWKEQFFINSKPNGLTIAGFYYICLRRSDGYIEGYYFDRCSSPYQKLTLRPTTFGAPQRGGMQYGNYSFA